MRNEASVFSGKDKKVLYPLVGDSADDQFGFSIAEVSIVAACFWVCLRRSALQEVLSFTREALVFETGRDAPLERREWQRFFTKIEVGAARHPWYSPSVALTHRGERLEIGRFLNAGEKVELLRELRQMIRFLDSPS